jgi:uncharacterized protein (TIGR03437 family)
MKNQFGIVVLLLGTAAALQAAPTLRLTQTAFGPIVVAQGSNGPKQTAYAYNIGDGSLNLKVASSDSWLVPALGTPSLCSGGPSCIPVQMTLQTAGLAKGAYTATVTVSDPNAVDAPQTITVTVDVGTNVPDSLTFYAPPNGTATASFNATPAAIVQPSTQSGGQWLSVVSTGSGSFNFAIPYTVMVNAANLSPSDYSGKITVSGSTVTADNKTVAVTLHVTTQPIAQPTSSTVQFNIAQGATKQISYVLLNNAGQGTLSVSGVTATTTSGGNWLTAAAGANNLITITADATGLSPGNYSGMLSVASNAVNGPTSIPVQLTVAAAGPPQISYGGVVNVWTSSIDDRLSQGDVVSIYGNQFTAGDPQQGSLPLPKTLATVQVLLNGSPIPVEYVSAHLINVQFPYDAPLGNATLQVVRNGSASNTVSVNIAPDSPTLLPFPGTSYVVAQTAQGGFEGVPPAYPAAHAGDVLVLYAIGLGATTPAVTAGAASPGAPNLANVTPTPMICLGGADPVKGTSGCVTPFFAGLTPGYFGLYQLNFVIPADAPTGDAVPIWVATANAHSNSLYIAIH